MKILILDDDNVPFFTIEPGNPDPVMIGSGATPTNFLLHKFRMAGLDINKEQAQWIAKEGIPAEVVIIAATPLKLDLDKFRKMIDQMMVKPDPKKHVIQFQGRHQGKTFLRETHKKFLSIQSKRLNKK
jgi:hypothetical protein